MRSLCGHTGLYWGFFKGLSQTRVFQCATSSSGRGTSSPGAVGAQRGNELMTSELDAVTAPLRMPLIWAETSHNSLRFPFGTGSYSGSTPKCSGYQALTWLPDRDQLLLTQPGMPSTHRENRKTLGFNCLKVIHFQGAPEPGLCCRVQGGQRRPFLGAYTLPTPTHKLFSVQEENLHTFICESWDFSLFNFLPKAEPSQRLSQHIPDPPKWDSQQLLTQKPHLLGRVKRKYLQSRGKGLAHNAAFRVQ